MDRKTRRGQRRQSVCGQCAQSDKIIHARIVTDANEAQLRSTEIVVAEPVEDLDEDQLVREPMVQPDDNFLVLRIRGERVFTRLQVLLRLYGTAVSGRRHETGANVAPLLRVEAGGCRAF